MHISDEHTGMFVLKGGGTEGQRNRGDHQLTSFFLFFFLRNNYVGGETLFKVLKIKKAGYEGAYLKS